MSAVITIKFAVPVGHQEGDFARLHGNGGDGEIIWESPVDNRIFPLFPDGAGIFGWGHAPYGRHPWGHAFSMCVAGFGHLPYGHHPWGHGTAVIIAPHTVDYCGDYKFGFACYDKFANPHEGTPEESEIEVHISPPAPSGLKKNSYDKAAGILTLDAAD